MSVIVDSWISLGLAIVFGVLGTISMKLSHGLKYLKPSIALAIFYTFSFIALTFAIKYIELSVVYAVWSGVGTIAVAAVGIFYFNESVSVKKIIFLLLIVAGVIGMHFGDDYTSAFAKELKAQKVIAHRGASAYEAENTMASFNKANALGIKTIEFDVALTKDKKAIIIHDETLERTTNGKGKVSDYTFAELRKLDAGQGQHLPSLQEIMQLVKEKGMYANVELKPLVGQEQELVEVVLQEMQPMKESEHILFSSFSVPALQLLHQASPKSQIGLLMEEWLPEWQSIAKDLNCLSINIDEKMADDIDKLKEIKNMGKTLTVYTVDDIDKACSLFARGVDAVFSNKPDKILVNTLK